jgi:hypothetical protein
MSYLCLEKGLQEEILAWRQCLLSGLYERPYYQEQRKGTIRRKETGTEQEDTTKNTFYLIIRDRDLFLAFSAMRAFMCKSTKLLKTLGSAKIHFI